MFKKTIKFTNFNGDEVEQDFYFHLSKVELLEMAANGNVMMERIQRIIATSDAKAIIAEFRELVKAAVGMRSDDGSRFIKSPEAQSHLLDSPAFDELLMELCTDAKASAEFVRQLVPEKMQKQMVAELEASRREDGSKPDPFGEKEDTRPAWEREHRHPTDQELQAMSKEELQRAFQARLTPRVGQ